MKYTDEGLKNKIDEVIELVRKLSGEAERHWKNNDEDFLTRATKSIAMISLIAISLHSNCFGILSDITERNERKAKQEEDIKKKINNLHDVIDDKGRN